MTDALIKALERIALLDPAETVEGYNEWGEALCFNTAQDIARTALASEPACVGAVGDEQTLTAAWEAKLPLQYLVTLGYDSEWTDYRGRVKPSLQHSRLAWRVKPTPTPPAGPQPLADVAAGEVRAVLQKASDFWASYRCMNESWQDDHRDEAQAMVDLMESALATPAPTPSAPDAGAVSLTRDDVVNDPYWPLPVAEWLKHCHGNATDDWKEGYETCRRRALLCVNHITTPSAPAPLPEPVALNGITRPAPCAHMWVESLRPEIFAGSWCHHCGVLKP